MKRSTALIAAGLVLALSPVAVVGATATGLTVLSAAIVPAPCETSSDGSPSCTDPALPAADTAWTFIVPTAGDGLGGQAAMAAVGRGGRYVAEGNGPVDFDCAGLTAWAWHQVGVSLPDYSYSQWDITARISREQLQPGI